ncbi:MAG TPA: YraN family protein [Jiangellaceae bacterium]|nr:YraN family protein [Jiangellaceae bacterium]
MRANSAIGAYGERIAVEHLERAGYTIIDRNWRCDLGEIDVVALDGVTVVVCEVKTRSGLGFGSGLEAVTPNKAARLRRLARRWLAETGVPGWVGLRFDVVAVHRKRTGRPEVVHLQDAF